MDASEAYELMTQRQDRHDAKCDERQTRIYQKFDKQDDRLRSLERMVYVGFGIVIALELGLGVLLTGILDKVF